MHYEIWATFQPTPGGESFTVYWLGSASGFTHARENKPMQLTYADARVWLAWLAVEVLTAPYSQLRIMHLLGSDWTVTAEKVFPVSPLEALAKCAE